MDQNSFYCPAPWTGGYFTLKEQAVCCYYEKTRTPSPLEFMASAEVQEIKRTLLAGTPIKGCVDCKQKQDQGLFTIRDAYYNTDPKIGVKWEYDAAVASRPQNIEVRFDNICNFKCRMCSPDWSHLMGQEVKENPNLLRWFANGTEVDKAEATDAFVEEILSMAPDLKKVYVTGGEPTISKPAMYFMDQLIERGYAKDIVFQYATNTSTINPGFLARLLEFKNVQVIMSIDATGAVAEYQRSGTDWPRVHDNIQRYFEFSSQNPGKINCCIHTVLTSYSILDVDRTMAYVFDIFDRYGAFGYVTSTATGDSASGANYSLTSLAGRSRREAIAALGRAQALIQSRPDLKVGYTSFLVPFFSQIDNLKSKLETEAENADAYQKFKTFTLELDQIRDESFERVFGFALD